MIKKIVKLLMFFSFIAIIFLICRYIKQPKVRVGIIDGMIDSYNIGRNVIVKDFCEEDYINVSRHGNTILSIINSNPNYSIYYAEVLNNRLESDIDSIINAIEWCINSDVQIINMSFSTLTDNYELRCAIKKAIDKGIIIVSSSFNNTKEYSYPADYENVISVSVDSDSKSDIILSNKYFSNDIEICNSYASAIVTKKICEFLYNS